MREGTALKIEAYEYEASSVTSIVRAVAHVKRIGHDLIRQLPETVPCPSVAITEGGGIKMVWVRPKPQIRVELLIYPDRQIQWLATLPPFDRVGDTEMWTGKIPQRLMAFLQLFM